MYLRGVQTENETEIIGMQEKTEEYKKYRKADAECKTRRRRCGEFRCIVEVAEDERLGRVARSDFQRPMPGRLEGKRR